MLMMDLAAGERPREKMIGKGASALSDGELLAVILRGGTVGKSALDLAREMLELSGGSLVRLFSFSPAELCSIDGIGIYKASAVLASFELGRRFLMEKSQVVQKPLVTSRMVFDIMIPLLKGLDHEECWVLFLTDANYLIDKRKLFSGGSGSTILDNRMVVLSALRCNASGLILVHNHPSQSPRPSRADIAMTDSLRNAANAFNIDLVDHVIVSDNSFYSFSEERCFSSVQQ